MKYLILINLIQLGRKYLNEQAKSINCCWNKTGNNKRADQLANMALDK